MYFSGSPSIAVRALPGDQVVGIGWTVLVAPKAVQHIYPLLAEQLYVGESHVHHVIVVDIPNFVLRITYHAQSFLPSSILLRLLDLPVSEKFGLIVEPVTIL